MPLELVVALVTPPVAAFVIMILVAGMTAPDESVTVPWMLPVEIVVWVCAREHTTRNAEDSQKDRIVSEDCIRPFGLGACPEDLRTEIKSRNSGIRN